MKLEKIIEKINECYPPEAAYDWDNPGLILGDKTREITKIMLTLDVTEQVLAEAVENGANLIISHHPVIFSGIKQINTDSVCGRIILRAAENKIALFAAHTNMDVAKDGVNERLADLLGLKNLEIAEPTADGCGLGRIGDTEEQSLSDFCQKVKNVLKTPFVRVSGNKNQIIKRVAVGSGSCSELIPKAIEMGADVIVTADLKYHTCLDYASDTFSVVDAGHFPTENMVRDMFAEILKGEDIVFSSQKDIFEVI